jgi:hypothetical protein
MRRLLLPGGCIAAAAVAAAALAATSAPDEDPRAPERGGASLFDSTRPIALAGGAPAGAAPMARLDAARSGRSATALPQKPRILWRQRVATGIDRSIAVDARGRSVAISAGGQLTQLDARGATEWTRRIGTAAPAADPVLLSGGARIVVTLAGEVVAVAASGKPAWSRQLPGAERAAAADPLPMKDGGVVVARHAHVVWLDAGGALRDEASLDEPVRWLLGLARDLVLVGASGQAYLWKPPGLPRRAGGLGGRPSGGVALAGRSLLAVVDAGRLVELELDSGTRHARVAHGQPGLEGPPALLRSGETRTATRDGVLLGHDARGAETGRIALEPSAAPGDAGAIRATEAASAPALVCDGDGRVAFARPGLDAGVVLPSGEVVSVEGAACPDPVALVPAGAKRMLLACRSGRIWSIGD